MKAQLFVKEVGATVFSKENGMFEDDGLLHPDGMKGEEKAYDKGEQMCIQGNVEAFQVWTLQNEYIRTTKIEVQRA